MLVCGQTERGTWLGTTAQELLLTVKAIVFNLYGSDLPKISQSEVSETVIVKPGL